MRMIRVEIGFMQFVKELTEHTHTHTHEYMYMYIT